MSYFSPFPYVLYPNFLDTSGNIDVLLKNITLRIVRRESLIDDKSVYYEYTIKDGQNIETISNELYGNPSYYWTIMVINNRLDRFYDFPLAYGEFEDYIVDKYGSLSSAQFDKFKYYIREDYSRYSEDQVDDKKYFIEVPLVNYLYTDVETQTSRSITEDGRIMKYSKSFYDIEFEENEAKRNISVCNSNYIQNFVDLFRSLT
jgi:hypothetical protein